MSTTIKRNFKGTAAEMLTAISAIVEAATDNEAALTAKRASWGTPFFSNLQQQVDSVTKTYLGADNVKDLRKATQAITQIQNKAIDALTAVKVQMERDFREDATTRDELLNELGFATYFKAAHRKSQAALVQLLLRFGQNLTNDVQSQLTDKGIDGATLTELTGYADVLNSANISQEAFKSSRSTNTQAATIAMNTIFNQVMDVAVIAAQLFKDDAALQSRFSYSKTLQAQKGKGGADDDDAPPVASTGS